jgi:heme O synthase-like polyprenyltransferase
MRWRTYIRLGRVSNLPTVWTNVLAGAVLAGGPLETGTLAALILSLSLFYVGGMYLNDAFDREIDARERPERPIPSGLISAREVFAIGFGLLAAAVLVLVLVVVSRRRFSLPHWLPVVSGLVLAAVITYYDAVHKRDPLSPVVMGLCRVLTYVIAAVAVAGALPGRVVAAAAVLLSYLIGLTYVAKQETLAEYSNLWPLAFLFAPFAYAAPSVAREPVAALIYVGYLAWVAYAISLIARRGRANIPRAVISFIAGISLLDALLIAGAGRPLLAVVAVGGFGLTLAGQRWVRGT